jgi:hypothetical protein
MTDAEMRAWHSCLFDKAHSALDEYVPEFWKDRLKYFSDIAGRGVPAEAENPAAPDGRQDPGVLVQEPSDLRADSDLPRQGDTKRRTRKATRKGDATLLGEKQFVSFKTAEEYLGISERHRQKLMKRGTLKFQGEGHNRKISTESLKACLRPEIPN